MAALAAVLLLPALAATASASAPSDHTSVSGPMQSALVRVCPAPPEGYASCHAIRNDGVHASTTSTPSGYGPADLWSAYKFQSMATSTGTVTIGGGGQTVAIVDAYDDPNAESDLGIYRSQYGLTPCTTKNGCFGKVDQTGGATYPKANGGWAQEISLDLDMVSAICTNCHILLVEASSKSYANLGAAVNEAYKLGATEISNSYGGGESSNEQSYDAYYNHPDVAITASSGDGGYGVEYPAASPYVTAVGGTHLSRASAAIARGWSETAWGSAGSGCSSYEKQQSWQTSNSNILGVCGKRAVADVSAVADPNTGVAVYDSYAYRGASGWMVFGGTSVASPIIASVYALAGNAATVTAGTAYGSYPYSQTSLFDVTSGSNGSCGNLLCNAKAGWDGPTGLGTPNGTGAF